MAIEQNEYKNMTPFKTWLIYQINTWGVNNFPFLENDFDKLTNYEMMMKLMKCMNDVLSNLNLVEDDMSKLYGAFTELQNYVNNYFDNLDVQEEINNKLDEMVEDGIFLSLFESVLPFVTPQMYGAKGDGINDDTLAFQNCLNSSNNLVFIPKGSYKVTNTLIIPFNKIIKGEDRKSTFIYGDFENDYILKYGDSYNYNGYAGLIENIRLTTNLTTNKPKGIYLNSGCTLKNIDFYRIGQAINRNYSYIDNITIENVYIGYCEPNGEYVVNLTGNQDGLKINQLKASAYPDDNTQYNGIYISRCHGGTISDSILNFNITIDKCNAFSINNTHIEVEDKIIEIKDSCVTLNNMFKWKNVNINDIKITSSNYDEISSLELNNMVFYTVGNTYNFNTLCEEIDSLDINTILKLNKCYRQFNFADKNRTSMTGQGIMIKNNSLFNLHSGELSLNGLLVNNIIKNSIKYEDGIIQTSSIGPISKSSIANWKGINTDILHYRIAIIIDEERKLIGGFSNDGNVTDINQSSIPIIAYNRDWNKDIYVFRGNNINEYNARCLIPNNTRGILLDNYYSINGYPWEEIETTNISSSYKRIGKYEKIGNNVIIESDSIPTLGIWIKGDKIINTNISSGQPISWIYDGTNWVSQGSYA